MRFSKEAVLFLAAYAATLLIGVLFGMPAFLVSVAVVYIAFQFRYPIPRARLNELSSRDRRAIVLLIPILVAVGAWWVIYDYPYSGWRSVALPAVFLWIGWRAIQMTRERAAHREEDTVIERARRLEKTDPAAAQQLLDSYFLTKADEASRERAKLWDLALQDRKAAARLQRILNDELRGHEAMRREAAALPPERQVAALEFVQQQETQTRTELDRVRAILSGPMP
jgi:hypothetical protein